MAKKSTFAGDQNEMLLSNKEEKVGPNGTAYGSNCDSAEKTGARWPNKEAEEEEEATPIILSTQRPSYDHEEFDQHYVYEPPPKSPWNGLRRTVRRGWQTSRSLCSMSYFFHWLMLEHFPMIDWVRHYSVKTMLTKDILAGITCGIMQVPQGMAYGMLSSAGPVAGLYTAFVPPMVYSAFASSRHVSVASFAVLSMLTASVIRPNAEKVKHLLLDRALASRTTLPGTAFIARAILNSTTGESLAAMTAPGSEESMLTIVDDVAFNQFITVRTATGICLAVGLFLLALGVLRLGFISCYLSDSLIAGFCAGAAVHIFTTQLFPALGLRSSNPAGWLMLYYSYKDLLTQIHLTNLYTLGLSLICISVLYTVKTYVNGNARIMKKMYGIPIPVELVLVVITTFLSYLYDAPGETMKIKAVGKIPAGLYPPSIPDLQIASIVFSETIIISFVILALTISIGRVLAKKNGTPLDPSTELRALGICNIAGSFYGCIPAGCAMARTMVLAGIGAPTQLTNFIGSAIVFTVLQWLGRLLEPLPAPVLASIVIVAVKPLFLTVAEFWRLLHVSWVDASIYLVTFTAIILGEVGYGIVIGLAYSIFTVVIRTQYPHVYVLGRLKNTELYQPLGEYRACAEINGIRILRISAPIYFANVDFVRTRCLELVFNTDKYRAMALQKRYRRCSQVQIRTGAVLSAEAKNRQELAEKIVRPSTTISTANMTSVELKNGTASAPAAAVEDLTTISSSESTLITTVNRGPSSKKLLPKSNNLRRPFSSTMPELTKKNSDATNNKSSWPPATVAADPLRQRSSSAGTRRNQGGGILVNNKNFEQESKAFLLSTRQQPKLSVVGELEERERRSRPPRLSVVFAGILIDNDSELDGAHKSIARSKSQQQQQISDAVAPHHVVLDCSSVSFVDTAGVTMLVTFVRECWSKGLTQVFFAHCPRNVREQIRRNRTICGDDLPDSSFFPTIHDASLHSIANKQQQDVCRNAGAGDEPEEEAQEEV